MQTSNLRANIHIFVNLSKTATLCICKVVWRRYLGEVGKFLSYFVANLSKTLHINFYQNRSSIVEVMTKKILVCFLCLTMYISYLLNMYNLMFENMLNCFRNS